MNTRLFVSIAVPIIAFSLTVAVSLWQRRAADPESAIPRPAPIQPKREAAAPPRIVEQPPPAAQPLELSPPAPSAQDETDPSRIDVPARLLIHPRSGQSTMLATLQNKTQDELDVRVTAVSAKTHMRSVVDVTLQPFERKNLSEAGLELASGDQLTLESPPYRDTTLLAR